MEKDVLFEKMNPVKALAIMAIPTIASQLLVLFYNIADAWYIGRTNNPYMLAASSLALTVYLASVALSNVFGVGGGSLMVRLIGEKKTDEARKVASYTVALSAIAALVFSLLVFIFMNKMLRLLGASDNTIGYARQYIFFTTVLGCLPTVLSMSMPQLIRNAGYAKEAGIGVGLGSVVNVILDPIFMFVILPDGKEVMGAAIATMLSNVISLIYFILLFIKLKDKTVLELPKRIEKIGGKNLLSFYSVGIPAAISIFLFDLVTIVLNVLVSKYGDVPIASIGIVLKLERIPINTCLGICLGMVPLIAYNYGAKNFKRMKTILATATVAVLAFSCICTLLFWVFPGTFVGAFIKDQATVEQGTYFLKIRCLALPFMMVGYVVVNYMNAINKGLVSFILALIRHLVLIIPLMLVMNYLWEMTGLTWSQVVSDIINVVFSLLAYVIVSHIIGKKAHD